MKISTYSIIDIGAVISACKSPHWFSPSTMRFFNTRLPAQAYTGKGGTYFVTSEGGLCGATAKRRYTVRKLTFLCEIKTVGEFKQYASRTGATARAKYLAIHGEPNE